MTQAACDAFLGSAALVLLEWAVVTWRARGEFAGSWETREGIWALSPLTWMEVVPVAVTFAILLMALRAPSRASRIGVALIASGAAAWV
ncbi:MAG TPA: hypothetical protein VGL13_09460, partial [Polyangiaceae bacterium]